MMSQQCSNCGAYFAGDETICQRCGMPRAASPYQQPPSQANPYQQNSYQANPYQQNPYQPQQNQGSWLQRYYSPQRVVRRWVLYRIIGLGISIIFLLACVAWCLLAGGLAALTNH
jgi:hypothetical protein